MAMTFGELIGEAVRRGIKSIEESEYESHKKRGAIAGFKRCLKLGSIEQFQAELQRCEEQCRFFRDQDDHHLYWEQRMFQAQVEYIYKLLCAAYHINCIPGFEKLPDPYVSAMHAYSTIVGVQGMTAEQVKDFWKS